MGYKNYKKAVFLDRDGVLNHSLVVDGKPYPPSRIEDFIIYPDAPSVLRELKKEGFYLIIVTNQPDVARGKQSVDFVNTINQKLLEIMEIDLIQVCYDENSNNYKPNPGMLEEAAKTLRVSISESYMIGDRWRDIGAGINAGCYKSILLDRNYTEKMIFNPDYVCSTLTQAKDYILEQESLKKYEK